MPDNNKGEQQRQSDSAFAAEAGPLFADLLAPEPSPGSIEYLGVMLEKGTGQEEQVPAINESYIEDEFSQDIQQRLAVAFAQHQATLLEGGTSLGKSTTVRKMAAELGWSVHSVNMVGSSEDEDLMGDFGPNPDKKSDADAEYAFFDGPVTAAIEEAAKGHKVLLLIDEINVARPNVMIRLHEIIDAYEKSSTINVTKKGGKHLQVVRENLAIVALANPPSRGGSGYAERTPLDKAQFRRWNYQKLPDEMPETAFEHSVTAMFGLEPMADKAKIAEEKYLHSGERVLSRTELGRIPGMTAMAEQYKIFHTTMKGKIEAGLGRDQPQPISYDDREEVARVTEFIAHFYNGDINVTMHKALEYYYANKIADNTERAEVLQLINQIKVEITGDERRRSILDPPEFDTTKPETLRDPEYIAHKLGELLEQGASAKTVLQSLAGNSSEQASMLRTELKGKAGTIKDYGKSLAGLLGEVAESNQLLLGGRKAAYFNSMAGIIGTESGLITWYLDAAVPLLEGADTQDKNAFYASLAGVHIEDKYKVLSDVEVSSPRALGETMIGCAPDLILPIEELAIERGLNEEKRNQMLAWALSGNDTERAWIRRNSLGKDDGGINWLVSLGGIDTEAAWQIRNESKSFLRLSTEGMNALALSLSGVYSPQAWAMRDELFGDELDLYALSIGGNWVLNAMRASEEARPGRTATLTPPSPLGPNDEEQEEEEEEQEEA